MRFLKVFLFVITCLLLFAQHTSAEVKIVASIPDFAAIAKEIGADKVKVESLSKGYQDPHFVDPKPSFVLKLNRADLLIYNGLDLEIGWLPTLITGSRNSKITSMDSPGHLNASTLISNVLEVPTTPVDRSMGDIHPRGNPHYTLDPRNGIAIAKGIAERLKEIDPENSSYYDSRLEDFVKRLSMKIEEWEKQLEPYRGTEIVPYHKNWIYLTEWGGFEVVEHIEPKPGIPPSPSHVANLIKKMNQIDLELVIAANYYPNKTAKLIADKTGATFLVLPVMVEGREEISTYFDLFDALVNKITTALKDKSTAINFLSQ